MIKQLTMAALVSAQLGICAPAAAADLARTEERRMGTFGGLTVRVPLDGSRRDPVVRAGLIVAPTLATRDSDGKATTRIGEGVELGYRSDAPFAVSIAGRRLSAQQGEAEDDDGNVSTGETIVLAAIGVIVLVAAAGTIWLATSLDDSSD